MLRFPENFCTTSGLLSGSVFLCGIVLVGYTVIGSTGLPHLAELLTELKELKQSSSSLDKRIADYHEEIGKIKMSSTAVEKRAREDLGFVREDEVVYVFR